MDLSVKVLGTSTSTQLLKKQSAPVLRIGSDSFTRGDLANVSCFNFMAAANLSAILSRELKAKNTRDVFEKVHPQQLALPRLGAVALAVLGAAFEAKGLGGNAPLEAWVTKHLQEHQRIVTFASLKHRDEVERAAEKKALKTRQAQRRDKAHTIRVERHAKRTTNGTAETRVH